jgi:Rod binding domain-containing protein
VLYVNPLEASYTSAISGGVGAAAREKTAFKELERVFVYMLLEEMSKSVPKSGLFGKGPESEYFNEMLNDAFAGEIAESGQFGIARIMEDQLRILDLRRSLQAGDGRDEGRPNYPLKSAPPSADKV